MAFNKFGLVTTTTTIAISEGWWGVHGQHHHSAGSEREGQRNSQDELFHGELPVMAFKIFGLVTTTITIAISEGWWGVYR